MEIKIVMNHVKYFFILIYMKNYVDIKVLNSFINLHQSSFIIPYCNLELQRNCPIFLNRNLLQGHRKVNFIYFLKNLDLSACSFYQSNKQKRFSPKRNVLDKKLLRDQTNTFPLERFISATLV